VVVIVAAAVAVRGRYWRRRSRSTRSPWSSSPAATPGRLVALAPLIGCYTLAVQRGWRWGLAGAITTALIGIVAVRLVLGDTETVGVVPIAAVDGPTRTGPNSRGHVPPPASPSWLRRGWGSRDGLGEHRLVAVAGLAHGLVHWPSWAATKPLPVAEGRRGRAGRRDWLVQFW
jgi:hypothetical protein